MARFLKCSYCDCIVEVLNDTGTPVVCCNKQMRILPIVHNECEQIVKTMKVSSRKNNVKIVCQDGIDEIVWVHINTTSSSQRKYVDTKKNNEISFSLTQDEKISEIIIFSKENGLIRLLKQY